MKKGLIVLVGVFVLMVASCSPRVSAPSSEDAKDIVSKIVYAKDDRTGLCYSIITSGRVGNVNDSGISHACVPCEKIPENLLAK